MSRSEADLILSFLEECQINGIELAEMRLQQRWQFYRYSMDGLTTAASLIEQKIEKQYRFKRYGYLVSVGLGVAALPLYLYIICSARYPYNWRLVFCLVAPAIIVFIRMYVGYLRDVDQKKQMFRQEMAALQSVLTKNPEDI